MAWIQTVDESEATGIVKEEYDAAIARAGQIYNGKPGAPPRLWPHGRGTLCDCGGSRFFQLRQSAGERIWGGIRRLFRTNGG